MKFQKILIPLVGIVVLVVAYRNWGLQGIALAGGGLVMWAMLHVTRMMQVMKKAAERPIGHVASAVMLNAKLKPGVNLLHIVAMTQALGLLRTPKDTQPEIFRWTDAGGSYVDCTLVDGKLTHWELTRPTPAPEAIAEAPPAAPAP